MAWKYFPAPSSGIFVYHTGVTGVKVECLQFQRKSCQLTSTDSYLIIQTSFLVVKYHGGIQTHGGVKYSQQFSQYFNTCVREDAVALVPSNIINAGPMVQARVGGTFIDISLAVWACRTHIKHTSAPDFNTGNTGACSTGTDQWIPSDNCKHIRWSCLCRCLHSYMGWTHTHYYWYRSFCCSSQSHRGICSWQGEDITLLSPHTVGTGVSHGKS